MTGPHRTEHEARSPRFFLCSDSHHLATVAADRVQTALAGTSNPTLLVATGKTPRGLYAELAARRSSLAWGPDTQLFALDEYLGIAPDHPQSFRTELLDSLISPLGLRPDQLHTPQGNCADPEAESVRYENQLADAGYAELAIVGVGRNGHVAFNEPGTSFDSSTHVAQLTRDTREANASPSQSPGWPPSQAITVGIGTLLRSRSILVLADGAHKSRAIAALGTPGSSEQWPISALWRHPDVSVCVDYAAGSALGELDESGHPIHTRDDL